MPHSWGQITGLAPRHAAPRHSTQAGARYGQRKRTHLLGSLGAAATPSLDRASDQEQICIYHEATERQTSSTPLLHAAPLRGGCDTRKTGSRFGARVTNKGADAAATAGVRVRVWGLALVWAAGHARWGAEWARQACWGPTAPHHSTNNPRSTN